MTAEKLKKYLALKIAVSIFKLQGKTDKKFKFWD